VSKLPQSILKCELCLKGLTDFDGDELKPNKTIIINNYLNILQDHNSNCDKFNKL